MKKINFKKLKFGINNTVIVVFAVVIVLLLNIVTVLLESKNPKLKIDLTENAVTKISNETKALLQSIDESDTEIELLYLKGTTAENARVRDVLEQYDAYCDNITYKTVNYHTDPMLLSSFGIDSNSNVDGSILVATKDKTKARIVNAADMEISYNNNTVFLIESLLTNAIGVVASEKQMRVCFTTGHGEIIETIHKNPVSGAEEQGGLMLINTLKSENIAAYQYDISTGEIPTSVDLIIIMAPVNDFTMAEINALDDYMLAGGNAIVALPFGSKLERLEAYLSTWGITANNDIIRETDASGSFDEEGIYFYPKVSGYEAVADIGARILASYARSLKFNPTGDIEADVLLSTSDAALSMPIIDSEIDPENITQGKFDLGYILEKPLDGSFENTSKLIVSSTSSVWGVTEDLVNNYDSLVYYSLAEESFGNMDFVMNMLSDVFGEEIQSIYVPLKSRGVSVLTMSETQAIIMKRVFGIILPATVLLWGVVIWLKRRNK